MHDDAQLLRRYAEENSESAFADLVQRHIDLVYGAALRLVESDSHRAQDVTQIVFTLLARKAASLAGHPVLAGWLYNTTQHVARRAQRSEWRRRAREQEAFRMSEASDNSGGAVDWTAVRPVLDDAMRELSERDRETVVLRFFSRRPFGEIGVALHISEDAARMRVERALDKLRGLLVRRGVTSSTAALGVVLANHAAVAAPATLAATVTGAALAPGMGALLSTAGILMSKNVLIAATAAALAIGFGAYEHRRAGQAEEAAAGIARERDDLLARLRSAPSSGPAIGRTDPAPRKNPDSVNSAPSHPPTIDAAQAANKAAAERTQQEAQRNSGPDNNTRALYRLMNFTPAQIEQFQALVARNNRRQGELVGLMAASPGSAEEIQAMKDRVTAEFTVDLRAAFGDALARQIEQYRETLPLRAVTERLANSLFYTDAPLTASQVEKLIPILAQHARGPDGSIALASLDVEAALPEAQRVLSASQLADLRNVSNQYLAQTRRLRETQERTSRERGAR